MRQSHLDAESYCTVILSPSDVIASARSSLPCLSRARPEPVEGLAEGCSQKGSNLRVPTRAQSLPVAATWRLLRRKVRAPTNDKKAVSPRIAGVSRQGKLGMMMSIASAQAIPRRVIPSPVEGSRA